MYSGVRDVHESLRLRARRLAYGGYYIVALRRCDSSGKYKLVDVRDVAHGTL